MQQSLLENALKGKSLSGIRTNAQDWGESIIGFIVELDDLFFTINEIDEYGFYIGNSILEIENILSINIHDRYIKRLKFIHEHQSSFNPNNRITICKEGSALIPHLNKLIEDKIVVTFWFNEDDYLSGIPLKFDNDYILINNIGSEGDDDGISCNYIDKLTCIKYGGLEEQKIDLLYKNRSFFCKELPPYF